jgi:Family of unknown function (DUF6384)
MSSSVAPSAKLDDLMMAMDVVDTIRHREDVLERELSLGDRDEELIQRLRDIYKGQGIEVTDAVLKEGVKALKEQRFQYKEPPDGLLTGMFRLWIKRGVLSKWLAAILVVVGLGWYANAQGWFSPDQQRAERDAIELQQVLPDTLRQEIASTRAASRDPAAEAQIAALALAGETAIKDKNAGATRQAIADLKALRARLTQQYELVIVSRPGERTGVFRIPDDQTAARNYYLIVEAIDPTGRKLSLPIKSEENQRTETVDKFAIRVPKSTYDAVVRDKQDDGIVQDNVLGRKQAGFLENVYGKPVQGGMITKW